MRKELWAPFEKEMVACKKQADHTARFEEGKRYLSAGVYDSARFEALFLKDLHFGLEYTAADARTLLPLVGEYRKGLEKRRPATPNSQAAFVQWAAMNQALFQVSRLEQALKGHLASGSRI